MSPEVFCDVSFLNRSTDRRTHASDFKLRYVVGGDNCGPTSPTISLEFWRLVLDSGISVRQEQPGESALSKRFRDPVVES